MAGGRIAVLGGGLAGITAALGCADAGAQVTLVEVRPRLGGAVYSFERDGLPIDNGQHVFLRCCSAYRALLARLGSNRRVHLQPRMEIPVLSVGGEVTVLRRSAHLPAPLHLAGALLRYRHLSMRERLRAGRAARALGRLDPSDPELDRRTLGDWLSQHGQSPASITALWDLIALPTLNLPARQASLALGAFVFRTGLLASADAGDIGFHIRPLSEVIGDPAERELRRVGVDVRLGCRAEGVHVLGDGFEIEGGRGLHADAVIVAVPHQRLGGLLDSLGPKDVAEARALAKDVAGARALAKDVAGARALESSPIVNLHILYDRPVCELAFAAGVGTPVQYVFDRSEAAGLDRGRYLAVSLSGAEEDMRLTPTALRERYLPALTELFPRARAAKVEGFVVTREHAATFRAAPGVGALRPGARTSLPGLVLAGAYTDTGWPATLEGAVLSGHTAAREALKAVGSVAGSDPVGVGSGSAGT
ncbi:MAG TPA: hydroxysqualene dehydroxylase HpnE [Solirubrobacteraceae bacterium]|jgi:squalene-associated FAD-dependent desaturase|nr:hydroxysqualene dehydroxylase HpnE [Solirubrobacteraceae bacterium]